MSTANEINRGQAYERTLTGQRQRTRTFHVALPIADVNQAFAADVPIDGLPGLAEPDPLDTTIIARTRRAREISTTDTEVDVVYASASVARFQYAPSEFESSGSFLWSVSFETFENIKIPFAYRRKLVISAGGSEVTKQVWDVGEKTYAERRTVVRAEWELTNPTLSTIVAFETQQEYIHLIGGYKYLFRPASLTPKGSNANGKVYRVVGSWTYDGGTRSRPSRSPSHYLMPGDGAFTINPAPASGYMRDPYNSLDVLRSDDPVNQPATLIQIRDYYDGDLDAWQSLPGVPNL